jgi:hypothetical protein
MPYVRNATDVDPAALANVVGMNGDKTLGPFVDSFGVAHWVDLIPIPGRNPRVERDAERSRLSHY